MASNQQQQQKKKVIVLGSSSKWRRMVLEEMLRTQISSLLSATVADDGGSSSIAVEQWPPDIDEKAVRDPCPEQLVLKVARAKMAAVIEHYAQLSAANGEKDSGSSAAAGYAEWYLTGDQVSVYRCKSDDDPMLTESTDRYIERAGADNPQQILHPLIILEKPESVEENRLFLRSYSNYYVTTVASQVLYHVPTRTFYEGIDRNVVKFGPISEAVMDEVIGRGDSMKCCGGFVVEDESLNKCVVGIDGSLQGVQGLGPELLCRLMGESMVAAH